MNTIITEDLILDTPEFVQVQKACDFQESEVENQNKLAIQTLAGAFEEYKNALTDKLSRTEKALRSGQTYSEPVNNRNLSSTLLNYVTKNAIMPTFKTIAGYNAIPHATFYYPGARTSLMSQLATVKQQSDSAEHKLLSLGESFQAVGPTTGLDMILPVSKNIQLKRIETGMFLELNAGSGAEVANLDSAIQTGITTQFAISEDNLFFSDDGFAQSIDGIGNLSPLEEGENQNSHAFRVSNEAFVNEINDLLCQMLAMLPYHYHEEAVWLTSPNVYFAIKNMRDASGRFVYESSIQPSLFGKPVYCHSNFNKTTSQIVLANVKQGYHVIEYPYILSTQDHYRDRRGVHNYFIKMIGGAVTDPNAWVSLKVKDFKADSLKFKAS